MTDKTKRPRKFPGFFECQHHDRLGILLQDKPPTLCRHCFKKISKNLTLYLGQTMTETLALENLVVQHGDMIEDILDRLDQQEAWNARWTKTKTEEIKQHFQDHPEEPEGKK